MTVRIIRIAGATPKLMTSHMLSSWAPKSLVLRAKRASRPSIMSQSIATKSSQAETPSHLGSSPMELRVAR